MHVPYRGSAPAMQDRSPAATPSRSTRSGSVQGLHRRRSRCTVLAVCSDEAPGGVPRRADGAGEARLPLQCQHLEHDLRAGRHATTDRRQAQRHHQRGDQELRNSIEKAKPLEIEFVQSTPQSAEGILRTADGLLGADREGVRGQGGVGGSMILITTRHARRSWRRHACRQRFRPSLSRPRHPVRRRLPAGRPADLSARMLAQSLE